MSTAPRANDPSTLPTHLAERSRAAGERTTPAGGEFVLYWMRTAVRAEENPALDVALLMGDRLDLPVVVYHALSERYPFASDRHHTFVLEGARDVQRQFARRGIAYAFHLERPGDRGPHLRELARRAALVVTEEMPVRPLSGWTRRLARSVDVPVWLVDTACVVPMRLAGERFDRAFAYRRATAALRAERLTRQTADVAPHGPGRLPALPFEPVELQHADLAELVASCEIDHTVGPVPHTPGGSTAGYARWDAFRARGLARYAADRNDALRDGVSRMSAYLHYGHVSPFRIAREAAARGGAGAEKYLDELLVWRELAYTYCFHDDDPDSIDTLPEWARCTLAAHASDARPALHSHETLARARTGDALWDAAQTSLLIHGELHNNVRMTWGKALPSWTPDAARALELLIDLNHRYALDGRDPSSYGGLLWCLGQFDRPFTPEQPVLGSVRPRTTEHHARRLDVERYMQRVSRAAVPGRPSVAVVGAGISGLTCARTLEDHGIETVVFDAAERPGGRMATGALDGRRVDRGAQYFTARDPRFALRVRSWIADGLVAEWDGTLVAIDGESVVPTSGSTKRFVGVPGMDTITAHLATDLDVRHGVTIRGVVRRDRRWYLGHDANEEGPFDALVVAIPAPSAVPLLGRSPQLRARAATVTMHGCWAVTLVFDGRLPVEFDGAFVNRDPLSWIARDGSKPGRSGESWVLHGSPRWSEQHLELEPDQAAAKLIDAFKEVAGLDLPDPIHRNVTLWSHAIPASTLPESCLFDGAQQVAVCGDWCGGPRVEGAYLSGAAAAGRVLGALAAVCAQPLRSAPPAARARRLQAGGETSSVSISSAGSAFEKK